MGSLNTLMHPTFPTSSIPVIGVVIGAITVVWDWIQALFTIIFLKFDFFSGQYMIVWYIFCLPIGIGLVVTIVLSVIRGTSST